MNVSTPCICMVCSTCSCWTRSRSSICKLSETCQASSAFCYTDGARHLCRHHLLSPAYHLSRSLCTLQLYVCRGLSLRGCEDIDDAAVLMLSKYTAASDLPERFSSLNLASSNMPDATQAALDNPGRATEAMTPSYRNVSLQRTLLSNSLQGIHQAAANRPNQQPVLDPEAGAKHTGDSSSAQGLELHHPHHHSRQHSSLPDTCSGKLWLCAFMSATHVE